MPDTAPSPAPPVVPILDDAAAVHAALADEDSFTGRTVCDLPLTGDTRLVDNFHNAIGVTCLICLAWLGSRHTTPPVVVKGSWYPHMPPSLPGESDDAFTNRLTGAAAVKYLREHGADMERLTFAGILAAQVPPEVTIPYDHARNRQCSINYHDECSDPAGVTCECPCHRQPPPGTMIEIDGEEYVLVPPEQPTDALISKIMDDVLDELMRARAKFPGQHLPLGFGPKVVTIPGRWANADEMSNVARAMTDEASDRGRLTWAHVLSEEFWEALAEDDKAKARAELMQLAAMCVRAMLDIDDPQPVHYTGPSGVTWDQVGTDVDGDPVITRHVKAPLTPSAPAAPASTPAPEAPRD